MRLLSSGIQFNGFVSLVLGSTMFGIGAWTCWVYTRPVVPEEYIIMKCSLPESKPNIYAPALEYLTTNKKTGANFSEVEVRIKRKCRTIEETVESSLLRHSMWIVCLSVAQVLSASFILPSLTNEVVVTEAKHWMMMQCLILCSYSLSFISQVSSIDRMTSFGYNFGLQVTDSNVSNPNHFVISLNNYHSGYIFSFLWSIQICIALGFINAFIGGIFFLCLIRENNMKIKYESSIQLV